MTKKKIKQLENRIPIKPFLGDMGDKKLKVLEEFLLKIRNYKNLKNNFFIKIY